MLVFIDILVSERHKVEITSPLRDEIAKFIVVLE